MVVTKFAAVTIILAESSSIAGVGSVSFTEIEVIVFTIGVCANVPAAVTNASIVKVADAPLFMVPIFQFPPE